ncbi:uncharacterized protein EDB93DRAFT_1113787 [Suillus bovinus]|uniref:uncharacterized protein n=1 Tax=Suillus bovinus TaxID=48563 RepID=UPI001B87A2F8|nr:uncharacterized protein EDB93DRAFT_1113787 [Suillus bovinus]KAG2160183.1 hypothetical protein EDB93DRAFT_1113787 [Suillus bovinus]
MKFISLTIMIMSATMPVLWVIVQNPLNMPCNIPEEYGCGYLAGYNNDNPFLYYCSVRYIMATVKPCSCAICCSVKYGGVEQKCV